MTLSAGMRMEYFKIDDVKSNGKLSKKFKYSFSACFRWEEPIILLNILLRASYGQGYRFPSIAEKYISTFVGA